MLKSSVWKLKQSARSLQDCWLIQRNILSSHDNLAITYANDIKNDGCGSQLQRLYGVYSISRLIKVPYIHSPLVKVSYFDYATLEEKTCDKEMLDDYNRIFNISSDCECPNEVLVRDFKSVNLRDFAELKREAKDRKTFILARILLPYGITDLYPECYSAASKISPFSSQSSSTIRIAMHVRRGELPLIAPERMIPNHYFISVAQKVHNILNRLNLEHTFELYTEVALNKSELYNFEDFDAIPDLEINVNSPPIDPLQKMATSDILIISHSSYSYLSAILNKRGIVIYNDFWHRPMASWIVADNQGDFSEQKFVNSLKKVLN